MEATRAPCGAANNDNLVFTLNDLPPSKSSPQARRLPTKEKFIIANFGRFTSSKRIIAWGEKSNLAPISERQCCFIGVYYPKLNQVLGQPVLVVQSLKKCYSEDGEDYVCGVEWQGDQRYTTLYRFGYGWDSHYYWFGFAAMPR
jgi:hypothetical protein